MAHSSRPGGLSHIRLALSRRALDCGVRSPPPDNVENREQLPSHGMLVGQEEAVEARPHPHGPEYASLYSPLDSRRGSLRLGHLAGHHADVSINRRYSRPAQRDCARHLHGVELRTRQGRGEDPCTARRRRPSAKCKVSTFVLVSGLVSLLQHVVCTGALCMPPVICRPRDVQTSIFGSDRPRSSSPSPMLFCETRISEHASCP